MTIIFKNHYNQIGRKENFGVKYEEPDTTDQSQVSSASIVEMAKRYGIDAIIARAEQKMIEIDSALANQLYGNDYTQMYKSKEEMLNTKKKINNLFENIPARIRKEHFNDNPMEFINAYVSNDEIKLGKLKEIGLVSESQYESVKEYNKQKAVAKREAETQKAFISALEQKQGALYETFKQTGNINISIPENNEISIPSVQPSIS